MLLTFIILLFFFLSDPAQMRLHYRYLNALIIFFFFLPRDFHLFYIPLYHRYLDAVEVSRPRDMTTSMVAHTEYAEGFLPTEIYRYLLFFFVAFLFFFFKFYH